MVPGRASPLSMIASANWSGALPLIAFAVNWASFISFSVGSRSCVLVSACVPKYVDPRRGSARGELFVPIRINPAKPNENTFVLMLGFCTLI